MGGGGDKGGWDRHGVAVAVAVWTRRRVVATRGAAVERFAKDDLRDDIAGCEHRRVGSKVPCERSCGSCPLEW